MEIPSLLLQFGGSLLAILALFVLARAMRLGGSVALKGEADVRTTAGEVEYGFEPVRISIARGGDAALARDANGRIMVIKRHGNRFAGRVLTGAAEVREEVDAIVIDTGEARFGKVRLSLGDGSTWADAINRL